LFSTLPASVMYPTETSDNFSRTGEDTNCDTVHKNELV